MHSYDAHYSILITVLDALIFDKVHVPLKLASDKMM